MIIEIDFNSDEALYLQLRNQIIMGIATAQFREGDSLPSVRQLADTIGINMHTVNKAYTVLKQEGYVKVDRRKGAVIAVDVDRVRTLEELKKELEKTLATLTEKERKVVLLYYYEDLTLKEISNVLEVSESRVSQLHTRALQKMKERMGSYMGVFQA